MSRLTTRDYKKTASRSLDPARWREFGAGVLVGAMLVAVLFGAAHRAERAAPEVPHPEPHRLPPADAAAEPDAAGAQSYDFYQMLPHFEVVVPEKERDVKRDVPTANIERPGVYVLQAGSYRNESDADRVAKQLLLQGVEAKVQRVAVDTDVWFRVRVGPISQLPALNQVRRKLEAADIDAIVIRVGD
ncbi:MAG TPA: SPOR domain-containing protein [Steroidobacteraceae bacterium]|nr:SPOR domain-containing protein [Steroidobacteraceae bacterium]